MNWRIESIEIQNFKFFRDKFTFLPKRQNVLLYGENGSGKSSIYWSIFTLLQATTKDKEEATKYFSLAHKQNLRNRFATEDMDSYIRIIFSNEKEEKRIIEDSEFSYCERGSELHTFLENTRLCSDFLNYKFLSSIFNFSNNEENELFELFEKEFMQFISFHTSFTSSRNQIYTSLQYWIFLKDLFYNLPRNNNNEIIINSKEYKKFEDYLVQFNTEFRIALQNIQFEANVILLEKLNIEEQIKIKYTPASININTMSEGEFHNPKITLQVEIAHPYLKDKSPIENPRYFFNEAKLTCMALALRLAILELHPQLSTSSSLLLIDDLLISLDMGIRSQVVPVLLSYADRFHMFIFTHDRLLYRLIKDELNTSGKLSQWMTKELFLENDPYPKPVMREDNDYLGEARYHLSKHFYAAAANAARKSLEKILKRILPENKKYSIGINGDLREATLKEMTDCFLNICKDLGIDQRFKNLHRLSEMILNPLSHDDIKGPVFREEIEEVLKVLTNLDEIKKEILVPYESVMKKEYVMHLSKGPYSASIRFFFREVLSQWSDGKNTWVLPTTIFILDNPNRVQGIPTSTELRLKKAYQKMINHLSLKKSDYPLLDSFQEAND